MKNPGGRVKVVAWWGKMRCHGNQMPNFCECGSWHNTATNE